MNAPLSWPSVAFATVLLTVQLGAVLAVATWFRDKDNQKER